MLLVHESRQRTHTNIYRICLDGKFPSNPVVGLLVNATLKLGFCPEVRLVFPSSVLDIPTLSKLHSGPYVYHGAMCFITNTYSVYVERYHMCTKLPDSSINHSNTDLFILILRITYFYTHPTCKIWEFYAPFKKYNLKVSAIQSFHIIN